MAMARPMQQAQSLQPVDFAPLLANGTSCPSCGSTAAYHLNDGRAMCKACRLKYTPHRKPGRLDERAVRQLVQHFWRMVPLGATAWELGLDRKTVQRYFGLLRQLIARAGEERVARHGQELTLQGFFLGKIKSRNGGGEATANVPVFGLASLASSLGLIFPGGAGDWSGLDLSGLRFVAVPDEEPSLRRERGAEQAVEFWSFARTRLKHYRGGFKRKLPIYLREMEFRYNHHQDPQVVERLFHLLTVGPN